MIPFGSSLMDVMVRILAKPQFVKLNRFMFNLSIRSLGILNYRNVVESGEGYFLRKVFNEYQSDVGGHRRVVFDIGANVGNYSKEVLRNAPDACVYCFEPSQANARRLAAEVGSRVTVVNAALGAVAGTMPLFDYSDETGSSHASLHREVFEKVHDRPFVSQAVRVKTLDDFVAEQSIESVALTKIDVEGHELEVLKGAARSIAAKKLDLVQFEFNEMNAVRRVFLADFFAVLPGFEFYRLLPHGWIRITDRPIDNLFAFQNIVAVRADAPIVHLFQH